MALGLCNDSNTMDYEIPIMDGVKSKRYILRLGFVFQEDFDSFIRCGANTVLTKPLSMASFEYFL